MAVGLGTDSTHGADGINSSSDDSSGGRGSGKGASTSRIPCPYLVVPRRPTLHPAGNALFVACWRVGVLLLLLLRIRAVPAVRWLFAVCGGR